MSANEPLAKRENILGSRKTAGMVIGVISILLDVWLSSKMNTPHEVAIASLYMLSAIALYGVGGQALVDSVERWKSGPQPTSTSETTNVTRTVEVKNP